MTQGRLESAAPRRKNWLDWQRGVAVLLMVEVHTLDAWFSPAGPREGLWATLLLLGGFAAPTFLFMAGLSQSLADAALAQKGFSVAERRRKALRRAFWLWGVAYAFRLGVFFTGGAWRQPSGWQDLLRVDILNIIALSLVVSALLGVGVPARIKTWLLVAAASGAAFLAPIVGGWQHSPSRLLDYLYATWPRANFSFFPWAGFLLAGSAFGQLAKAGARPFTFLVTGAALFAGGQIADHLPPIYAFQDFWHTSPAWFAMRLGGVVALAGVLQLLPEAAERPLSWLSSLGRHSLLGYVVSVELTYGASSHGFHKALSIEWTVVGIVGMCLLTGVLTNGMDRWASWRKRRMNPKQEAAPMQGDPARSPERGGIASSGR